MTSSCKVVKTFQKTRFWKKNVQVQNCLSRPKNLEPASIKTETKSNSENIQSPPQDTSHKFVIIPHLN